MSEAAGKVMGHEWRDASYHCCCECGWSCSRNMTGAHVASYCKNQHAAHLAALASQVPAQPQAPSSEDVLRELTVDYCKSQLEIMDGSFEKGIARIGQERFEKMVEDVLKTFKGLR